jgi:virulence-associated protein VapD
MNIDGDDCIIKENVNLKENRNCDDILQKLDLININNGWNDNNEKIIISIGENCASYKWMHENCAVYHKCINILMNLLSIIFTSFLTAETFVKDDASDENIIIIRKTITYLLSVISLLQNFLNSEMLNSKHIHASNEFSKLYHDIQQQMCRFRRERKNATKYVSECLKHYDSLVINNPDINNFVLYKFKKIFGNNNVPSIEDRFNKIEIITEQTYQNKSKKGSSSDLGSDLGSGDLGSGDLGSGGGENYTTFNVIKNVNNNLSNINNIYKINGDISDNDLKKIDSIELKRFNEHKLRYEYNRFLQHSDEND